MPLSGWKTWQPTVAETKVARGDGGERDRGRGGDRELVVELAVRAQSRRAARASIRR
jgi:hypothetical protein